MDKLKSIFIISRPINVAIAFFAVIIAGMISDASSIITSKIIYAALSMAFACAAGNVINDIFDLEIDKINRPNRVLPSNLISVGEAKSLYFLYIVASLVFAFRTGLGSLIFMLAITIVIYLYSYTFKKIVLLGNIVVSLLTASALIYGAFVAGNIFAGIVPGIFAFLVNFIREIIKDMEDIAGDTAQGLTTFPIKFGLNKSSYLISALIIFLIGFSVYPFYSSLYKIEYFIIIMVIVNPIFVFTMKILIKSNNQSNLNKASNYVKLNMVIGLAAIFFGVR